jgi:hypothetical protein
VGEINGCYPIAKLRPKKSASCRQFAHALKTPLTVITNAAAAHAEDLDNTVIISGGDAPQG